MRKRNKYSKYGSTTHGDYSFKRKYPGSGGARNYGSRKNKAKNVLTVVSVLIIGVVLVLAGYALMNFIIKNANSPTQAKAVKPTTTQSAGVKETTGSAKQAVKNSGATRAMWMPTSILGDSAKLDKFISNAKKNGINAVVFDMKRSDGTLAYKSDVAEAATVGASSDTAQDLTNSIAKLSNNGIEPIARVYCFKDPLAPSNMNSAAVHYESTKMLWLDKSQANGGKPWLNPYSSDARTYLCNIIKELSNKGFKSIILDAVQFPSANSLRKASFGSESDSMSKKEALTRFVNEAETAVGGKSNIILSMEADSAINGSADTSPYFGNPLDFKAKICSPDLMISQLPSSFKVNGKTLNADSDPTATVSAAASALASLAKSDGRNIALVPWLEASSSTSGTISQQISALKNAGISSYILYNKNGSYNTTD